MAVNWFVYIVSNNAHTLYTGMTNDLPNRVTEHKDRTYINGFTARYTFDRLVYYQAVGSQKAAAKREKQVKGWPRARRVALIQAMNPNWIDPASKFAPASESGLKRLIPRRHGISRVLLLRREMLR